MKPSPSDERPSAVVEAEARSSSRAAASSDSCVALHEGEVAASVGRAAADEAEEVGAGRAGGGRGGSRGVRAAYRRDERG